MSSFGAVFIFQIVSEDFISKYAGVCLDKVRYGKVAALASMVTVFWICDKRVKTNWKV